MNKKKALIFLLILIFGVTSGIAMAGSSDKVTICHYPPGNPDNPQTITISINALPAHLAHGDVLGECPSGCLIDPLMCDDENLCTFDVCLDNGECQHVFVECDDGNICTDDMCVPTEGCVNVPIDGIACDDGNACTGDDMCSNTVCVGNPIAGCCISDSDCDDGDLCTTDVCSGNSCSNGPIDCTTADICSVGYCDPDTGACNTTPITCDDSNVCTDDYCDSVTGCYYVPTSSPPAAQESSCDDGVDNDCDGDTDCADSDCSNDPGCNPCVEQCQADFQNSIEDVCQPTFDQATANCVGDYIVCVLDCGVRVSCPSGCADDFTDCYHVWALFLEQCEQLALGIRNECLLLCE